MPAHDWTRVDAGIFHDFHHSWIEEIKRALNDGVLPDGYYALAEQRVAGFGPDVLALQEDDHDPDEPGVNGASHRANGNIALATPRVRPTAEVDLAFYRRKQNVVAIRHRRGDRIIAVIEVVSPGNKSSNSALRSFVEKATDLLNKQIHLLVLDLHPPGPRDPCGIHAAIWEEFEGVAETEPPPKPVVLASYDAGMNVRAYVETVAVGDDLPETPLFLKADGCVFVPLEKTYQSAFAAMPRRWQVVLEPPRN